MVISDHRDQRNTAPASTQPFCPHWPFPLPHFGAWHVTVFTFLSCTVAIQEYAGNSSVHNISQEFYQEIWQERMREIQGAIIIASFSQVIYHTLLTCDIKDSCKHHWKLARLSSYVNWRILASFSKGNVVSTFIEVVFFRHQQFSKATLVDKNLK